MSEKDSAPKKVAPEKTSKKILVADDSLTIQKVIRLALSSDGYEIQTVSDGKEAIEQASLFRPDICIIDVSLPQFDAYQVREQLMAKPDLKNVPVILMSSTFEKVDETRAQALGFAGHLIKPFDPSHLRSTLLSVANLAPQNDPIVETINSPIQLDPPNFENFSAQDLPPLQTDSPAGSPANPMDDIQQMAKNTFEMSGLDQHDWGMIELGKANDPVQSTAAPSSGFGEVSAMDFQNIHQMPGHENPQNPGLSTGNFSQEELESLIQAEVNKALEQMHSEIRDRIEHELRAEVHSQIPAMAEKIIKDAIHQLLSDPPV